MDNYVVNKCMFFLAMFIYCNGINGDNTDVLVNKTETLLIGQKTKMSNNPTIDKNNNTILIGALIPNYYFSPETNQLEPFIGPYISSAMIYAVNDINNNKNLLPYHKLQLIWEDTRCELNRTLAIQKTMHQNYNIDAYIAGGCLHCEQEASNAERIDKAFISYVGIYYSSKNKIPYTEAWERKNLLSKFSIVLH